MTATEIEYDGIAGMFVPFGDLEADMKSGDRRTSLLALRDYLIHELTGHRCDRCEMSQLKTGDTASLVLRLQKVLEEIAEIPEPIPEGAQVEGLAHIDEKRAEKNKAIAAAIAAQEAESRLDKGNRRESTGGRRSSGRR